MATKIQSLLLFCMAACSLEAPWLYGQPDSTSRPRWILVTTQELASAMEPLVARRQAQGFEVLKILRDDRLPNVGWDAEFIRKGISEHASEPNRATYVLLVGNWNEATQISYVPVMKGKQGRMLDSSTDHGYGMPSELGVPTIAVGRYPARSVEDVQHFVAKVMRYEDQAVGPWSNRLNLWIGHPGGNSVMEKKLGETVVQSAVSKSLKQLNSAWSGSCLIDFPNTPYSVDRKTFRERMQGDLSKGQCFTIYAGHSSADGIWSEDQFVFARGDWERIKIESSPGVVLTTGCYSCQMKGHDGIGFLTAAVLNPHGPVAGLGAFAESYAAHGQLAMDAFVDLVARPKPPVRLGEYWLSIAGGIGSGKMDPLTFWLYDQADGSRGATSLANQRLEHLEMWTLLGDPALKIPFLQPTLELDVKAEIDSTSVVLHFDVPPQLVGGTCELQTEFRPVSPKRKLPTEQPGIPSVMSEQLAQPKFSTTIAMPKPLEDGELRVRVLLVKDGSGALGVATKSLKRN